MAPPLQVAAPLRCDVQNAEEVLFHTVPPSGCDVLPSPPSDEFELLVVAKDNNVVSDPSDAFAPSGFPTLLSRPMFRVVQGPSLLLRRLGLRYGVLESNHRSRCSVHSSPNVGCWYRQGRRYRHPILHLWCSRIRVVPVRALSQPTRRSSLRLENTAKKPRWPLQGTSALSLTKPSSSREPL